MPKRKPKKINIFSYQFLQSFDLRKQTFCFFYRCSSEREIEFDTFFPVFKMMLSQSELLILAALSIK